MKLFYHVVALCLCSLFILLNSATASQEDAKVQAEGYGQIIENNVSDARSRAIQDALRQCVEQATGTMVQSETLVENGDLLQDKIFSRAAGFVESYEVVESQKLDAETFQVKIAAQVRLEDLANNLKAIGVLREQMGNPRIMVLMRERNMAPDWKQDFGSLSIAESAIMNVFFQRDDEFQFIDRTQSKANLERDKAQAAMEGNTEAAAALGLMFGADYVITGDSMASTNEITVYGNKMVTAQATVVGRLVRTSTAQVIGTDSGKGKFAPVVERVTGGATAIEKGAKDLATKLIPSILEHWRKEVTGNRKIQILVKNVRFGDLKQLQTLLETKIPGIQNVQRNEYRSKVALYQVESRNGADQLAESLDGHLIGKKEVIVEAVTGGRLEVTLEK
ncbi:MAG: hypothetical protein HQL54_13275 [Magnetococcales bacterium]|nr:hypothetical protein [Magnetococcales bacterium]